MKPLRVLQVCHDYQEPFAHICRQYVNAWGGHRVTTVFLKGRVSGQIQAQVGGTEVIFLEQTRASLRGLKFSALWQLSRLLRKHRYDVVIAHRYKAIYLVGLMSYCFHLPIIIGIAHEYHVFHRLMRSLLITFLRRQFLIAGVSRSVTANIAADCPSLVSSKRLFTLSNCINLASEQTYLPRQAARSALKIEPSALVIGTVGRLIRKKNHNLLIQALVQLKNSTQALNVKLIIIGTGPMRANLESLVQDLKLTEQVAFQGHLEQANRYVKAFDLFVLSSGEAEAFGFVLLEAMLGKVPVLSSNAPGPSEVVGDTGLQFISGDCQSLANQLAHFLKLTQEDQARLGQAGYQRVRQAFTNAQLRRQLAGLPGLNSRMAETS